MTPFSCAKEIAEYLKGVLKVGDAGRIYAGFLPKIDKISDAYKRCPAIAIRPIDIDDAKDVSTAIMAIYVVTFDDDVECGSEALYHLIESIRFELLSNNPIKNRWLIDLNEKSLHTSIPDEQFYPYWVAVLDFAVRISQPSNKKVINQFTR